MELSKQSIALCEPNLNISDTPDQMILWSYFLKSETESNSINYDKMKQEARRAGVFNEVRESYKYFMSTGRSSSLAAYLALAEWDLASIPNLNTGATKWMSQT